MTAVLSASNRYARQILGHHCPHLRALLYAVVLSGASPAVAEDSPPRPDASEPGSAPAHEPPAGPSSSPGAEFSLWHLLPQPTHDAIVSMSSQVVFRHSTNPAVEVHPAWGWGLAGTIMVTDWIGLRLNLNLEDHQLSGDPEYFGLKDSQLDLPPISGARIGVELEPRVALGQRLWCWASTGVAWVRFQQDSLVSTGAVPVVLAPRSGVLVELPVRVGVTVVLIPGWLGLSLGGRTAFVTSQTGELFGTESGSRQGVRQDTGMLVEVAGIPLLRSPWSLEVSLDLFL